MLVQSIYRTAKQVPKILNSWPLFKEIFSSTFADVDKSASSANKIRKLYQGRQSVSTYAADFRLLASDLDWNDSALKVQFRYGLSNAVRDMLLHFDIPDTLDELIILAIKCDNRLQEHRQECRFITPPPASSNQPIDPPVVSDAMEIDAIRRGPLSSEERTHRFRNRLCIVCGKAGHFKATCPVAFKPVHGVSADSKNVQSQ